MCTKRYVQRCSQLHYLQHPSPKKKQSRCPPTLQWINYGIKTSHIPMEMNKQHSMDETHMVKETM